jgi:hypothetical protein
VKIPGSRSAGLILVFSLLFSHAIQVYADTKAVSLYDAAQHAIQQSQLTLPGSRPFHLKAKLVESTNPVSDYQAEIEVVWVSPDKWRRTISSPGFSQILVANGDQRYEELKGNYYPLWLHTFVTALLDPFPMVSQVKNVNAQLPASSRGGNSQGCSRMQMKVGVPPVLNSAFLVFCFSGSDGLLDYIVTPGYSVEFKDYKPFMGKQVARRFVDNPEPGTTLEAKVTELTDLPGPDESLFRIDHPTPREQLIVSTAVSEEMTRSLAIETPAIQWPTVRDGKTSGVLSVYVSIDQKGMVREAWPLNSDNAQLDDAVRKQLLSWRFKPAVSHGAPTQLETILTFAFDTQVGNAVPILSDADARKLAKDVVEAKVPTGSVTSGTTFRVRVAVDETGKMMGVKNVDNLDGRLFMAALKALQQWKFGPYSKDGKPDRYDADIIFRVP